MSREYWKYYQPSEEMEKNAPQVIEKASGETDASELDVEIVNRAFKQLFSICTVI